MPRKKLKRVANIVLMGVFSVMLLTQCSHAKQKTPKPRILISTDIGGTDPDDFQSMIHLLMYADLFKIEGLVSTSFKTGTTQDLLDMIALYENDLDKLKEHAPELPHPDSLRAICKEGAKVGATYKGYGAPTKGSEWIIKCAKKKSDQPLWVLVWGGIEDVAQALHDAPEIEKNIKVYWIGGPNKKWGPNAYAYIAENHPNLWIIESNATYRGWFIDDESPKDITNVAYFEAHIKGNGAMGKDFEKRYGGHIKMGDTPSLAYVMNGNPEDPTSESWGGQYTPITHSSRSIFNHNTTIADTVKVYGIQEWRFKGPELIIPEDSVCFTVTISKQIWYGYYLGSGIYGFRYSSKKPETGSYITMSDIPELNEQHGQYVSIKPCYGKEDVDDYKLGPNWYGDLPNLEFFFGEQQGARTISKHREAFLMDWAKRWEWLKN
ncbi:nucleoside hydrolase-like domain-containing protein [Thalassobellus suaedae]|uniref:DUF1593 domain-containing protein n=1 Tax=Thalassobellus suaedae TaxID=3074124 RepID=A0ABY9XXK8_9FLAO|nr:DUF1593 domain-containing protein [Flavobacteriaceae bacterium HL-DH14]